MAERKQAVPSDPTSSSRLRSLTPHRYHHFPAEDFSFPTARPEPNRTRAMNPARIQGEPCRRYRATPARLAIDHGQTENPTTSSTSQIPRYHDFRKNLQRSLLP